MIAVPATATGTRFCTGARRSWLLEQLEGLSVGLKIRREMARLDRAAAARLEIRDGRACLLALAREASRRFPVDETYAVALRAFDPQENSGEWLLLWSYGIPCDVQGYHPDDGDHVLDLAALDVSRWFDDAGDLRGRWDDKDQRALAAWWPGALSEAEAKAAGYPGVGRGFAGAWSGLPDLVAYVRGETMNGWLDANFEDADSMQAPEWTADEIRSMERVWQRARPVLGRIRKLTGYIEQDPARLKTLDKALRSDPDTLRRITRPRASKTLAEVFGKAKR